MYIIVLLMSRSLFALPCHKFQVHFDVTQQIAWANKAMDVTAELLENCVQYAQIFARLSYARTQNSYA